MEKGELISALGKADLFKGVSEAALSLAAEEGAYRTFNKGDDLSSGEPSLCLIISGKARVTAQNESGRVTLNVIPEGGVFGAARLFGGMGNVSRVTSSVKGELFSVPQATVEKMLLGDGTFALNYIRFLSDRVRFLNERIASFTSGSCAKRLARLLIKKADENGLVTLKNMSAVSKSLDVSRASLYRTLDELTEKGLVEKVDGGVRIKSIEKLNKFYGGKEK